MKPPRGLTAEESALWAKVARSVTPLHPRRPEQSQPIVHPPEQAPVGAPARRFKGRVPDPFVPPIPASMPAPAPATEGGLDSHWERRLARSQAQPDFTLDLHGHTLEQAHRRLDMGLAQAKAMGARLVLVITGKPRPSEAADRAERRGAIRAKILDWLAAGPHASDIAAVRGAQRRHGGDGALYLVMRRKR